MFGILFRVKVKPHKRKEFIRFITWDIQVAHKKEPGTLRFDCYQDPKDKNAFYVYEAYRNKAAFKKHQQNEPYQQWEPLVKKTMLLTSPQDLFRRTALCSLPSPQR